MNGITNPRNIHPMQVLIIPGFESIAPVDTSSSVDETGIEIRPLDSLISEEDLDTLLPEDVVNAPAIPIDDEPVIAE
ncbi:MAG: hypothetical protein JKY51_04765 [Opitutaceae bacterium]|nr:hypothetical protein [Opitutaceae bacterium]